MRSSMEEIDGGDIKEIKNISGRRSIRDNYNYEEISSRKKVNNNEDRSISEPPQSRYSSTYINNHNTGSGRLKTIREKQVVDDEGGSSEDEEDFSKSNSQLNESDLDLEIPESASHTPTPTLLTSKSRRINSETNLNDSKRRLTGFMGNRSKRFCASTSELNFASHLDTHKSLFSPKNNQNSRSGSLFGSNMSLNSSNSRLFVANSPFYNGKTTFGGASAYPRRDINQHKVLRTPIQMRPSSSLSNSSNTSTKSEGALGPESNAAKRILEIMTQFSGPLKETRNMGNNINSMIKIPGLVQTRKRFGDEDLQLDRSISLTRPTAPYSRPLVTSKNQQQPESPSILLNSQANSKTPQIPTMSQLLKMKRLQNSTERVREIANRSESFLNQTHEYKLPSQNDDLQSNNTVNANSSSSSSSFKMKSNITKNLLRNDKGIDELPPAPLNLPNIQLPELKSIPKFDIKLPNSNPISSVTGKTVTSNNIIAPKSINIDKTSSIFSSNTSLSSTMFKTATEMTTINQSTEMIQEKTASKINSSNFIFSKPIRLSVSDADTLNLKVMTDSFKFSKPILIDNEMESSEKVLEIQPTKPVTDNLFKNLVAQQKSQSWECDSCMTRNDSDKTKCLCCDTARRDSGISSKSNTSTIKEPSKAPPTDDLFKTLAAQQKKSQWDCTECFSKNDLDKEKCLCCETPKPGSKPITTTTKKSSSSEFKFGMPAVASNNDDLFKNLAAQQKKANWECSDCMTSNDVNKEKCACCEAPKPGSKKAPSQTSNFSFGVKPSTSDSSSKPQFSFGMPASTPVSSSIPTISKSVDPDFKKLVEKQSANWECSACMTRNDQSKSKCICCEQAKPGSSENKSQFSFGSKVTSSISLPAPSEVKFSFGVQPVKSDTALIKDDSSKKDEKVDEVDKPKPTFSFGAVSNASSTESAFSAPTFTFKSPQTSTVNASFTMKSPNNVEENKKVEEVKENSKTTEKGTEKTSIFSFGSKPETVPEKKVAFDIQPKAAEEKPEKTEEKKAAGGFSFPISSTPIENANSAPKTNGGFSFGGFSKPEAKEETKPASGGFQFGAASTSSPFSSTAPKATDAAQPTSTFAFESPKTQTTETSEPQKPAIFGSFGNTTQTASPFSSTSTNPVASSSTPVFGQNATSSFSFGGAAAAKKDENTPVFAFGNAKPAANSNMVFGSSTFASSASTPSVTPMFGANPTPTFGSNLSTNNNNESGFGSKMVGFGGIQSTPNQPQKRAFDFGSSDVPQKKFDFGQQQPQLQQSSSAPFQFNAQGSAEPVKPAFSFSATPAPQSFNFTGVNSNANNNVGNNNAQTQPPQPAAANIMQFGATSAPTVAIPGINAFGAAQSAATTPQRKILRASRRATRR
ncbi:nuclear pore complex protein Nup153 isoform X2 [Chironomus tepperi]|uniref:nuclear pore complex protein Nup153 isoform X2 n=1 Tax=Chironomus tepperi TaxID=113505 RepID=UPI00391F6DAD